MNHNSFEFHSTIVEDLYLFHSSFLFTNIIKIPKIVINNQIKINHFQSDSVINCAADNGFKIHINQSHIIQTHNQTKELNHKAHNNTQKIATSIKAVGLDIQANEKRNQETIKYFIDSISKELAL